MITKASNTECLRNECIEYIKKRQFKKVLDVGGSMFPWAREVVTHYFDLQDPKAVCGPEFSCPEFDRATFFNGDICNERAWGTVAGTVDYFDFAICSQTIEDVRDPSVILRNLPLIANEGFVTVPSKYRELSFVEGHGENEQREWRMQGKYRGYCHHRWIFTLIDGTLFALPKLNFVEHLQGLEDVYDRVDEFDELGFFWSQTLPFELLNNDFLGPNPPTVFDMYRDLLRRGL